MSLLSRWMDVVAGCSCSFNCPVAFVFLLFLFFSYHAMGFFVVHLSLGDVCLCVCEKREKWIKGREF